MRQRVLTQYGWLCLCHYIDVEPSQALSPPVRRIVKYMAHVAFEAVGHKKRFKLLTQHVLPSRPLYTPCLQISFLAMVVAYALCWQTLRGVLAAMLHTLVG